MKNTPDSSQSNSPEDSLFAQKKTGNNVALADPKTTLHTPGMFSAQSREGKQSRRGLMGALVFIIATASLMACGGEAAGQDRGLRVWRDSTGDFSVKATLVRKTKDKVTLLTSDGREVSVPLSRLSDLDRRYLSRPEAGSKKRASPAATSKAIEKVLAGTAMPPAKIRLADLPKLLQVPVFIEKTALERMGLTVDIPVNLKGGHGSFEEQLDDALEPIDLAWCTTQTVLVITTKDGMYRFTTAEFYRIPTPRGAFNGRGGGAAMFDTPSVLGKVKQVAPDSWDVMGGPGTVSSLVVPVYVVCQSPVVHRQIRKAVTCQPIPRQYGHPFDLQSVTVSSKNQSLEDVLTSIATQLGLAVEFSTSVSDIGIDPSGSRLDLDLVNVSGKDALDLVLSHVDCTWVEENDKLVVRSMESAEKNLSTQRISTNVGPIMGDSRLMQAIQIAIAPDTWDVLGGEGKIRVSRPGLYIVQQGQPAMRELEQWMRDLNALR